MNTRQLFRREPWMTTAEWRHALRYRRALLGDLDSRGIYLHPAMAMRLHNYLLMLVLTLRVESAWLMPPSEDAPPPVPTPEILEAMAFSRIRLSRMLAEIELGTLADPIAAAATTTPVMVPAPAPAAEAASEEAAAPAEHAAPLSEEAPLAAAPPAPETPTATPAVSPNPATAPVPARPQFPAQRPVPPRPTTVIYTPRRPHDRHAPNGAAS